MSIYEIVGGNPIEGSLNIQGSKNSVLPILAASILSDEKSIIKNYPHILDVENMIDILTALGCKIKKDDESIEIDPSNIKEYEINSLLASKLRSSIFLLGPMLSKIKIAKIAYPGGCDIGLRPIDIHIQGLMDLNIDVVEESGSIICSSKNAKAGDVTLDISSVGATENIMMASVFLKGETVIRNAAKEPEIVDLQNFLNKMGAKISGAGSGIIRIEGVDKLKGVEYEPIPDRIVLGTYMIATAMTRGRLEVSNYCLEHVQSLVSKLRKSSCQVYVKNGKMQIRCIGRPKSIDKIETMFYPGFPTDLQAQILSLQCISKGYSVIVENIFESRYKYVSELSKMGANITVKDRVAFVKGVEKLHQANLSATDLRGGAALVLAALVAEGKTTIKNIFHIDMGYEDMAKTLSSLGINIYRIENE